MTDDAANVDPAPAAPAASTGPENASPATPPIKAEALDQARINELLHSGDGGVVNEEMVNGDDLALRPDQFGHFNGKKSRSATYVNHRVSFFDIVSDNPFRMLNKLSDPVVQEK